MQSAIDAVCMQLAQLDANAYYEQNASQAGDDQSHEDTFAEDAHIQVQKGSMDNSLLDICRIVNLIICRAAGVVQPSWNGYRAASFGWGRARPHLSSASIPSTPFK